MTTQLPAIQAHNLTFSLRSGTLLLDRINYVSKSGITALLGKNGSGKSTLGQLLSRQLIPDSGRIEHHGQIIYLAQNEPVSSHPLRLIDGLGLGEKYDALRKIEQGQAGPADFDTLNDHWLLDNDISSLCKALKLPCQPEMLVEALSGGERMRIRIQQAISAKPDFLILDEPTNHLDRESRQWLQLMLRNFTSDGICGVLVISHDMSLLNEVDHILELNQGKLLSYGGNYQMYREQKENEQQAALHTLQQAKINQKQTNQQLQKSLEKSQKRAANAHRSRQSGGQAKILLDSAKERSQHTLNRLSTLSTQRRAAHADAVQQAQQNIDQTHSVQFDFFQTHPSHNTQCLTAINLVLPYGNKTPLNFTLNGLDKLWLQGANGSGKSTLLKVITQQLLPAEGFVKLSAPTHWLSQQLFSEDTSQINPLEFLHQHCPTIDDTIVRTRLAQIGLRSHQLNTLINQLSGGEQVKLAMLKIALQPEPGLLLLDEPDNHLDLDAKHILAQALADSPGAAVLISHDPAFAKQAGFTQSLNLNPD